MSGPETTTISIQRLAHGAGLPLPEYQTKDSAGMDLCAALENSVTVSPGAREMVPTGIAIALPSGYEAQIRPRSGLAAKHGVTLVNTPGTVDADYRGEIKVLLINHGHEPFVVERGMRIAQMIVAPVTRVAWQENDVLSKSDRGAGGFGSTGAGDRFKRKA